MGSEEVKVIGSRVSPFAVRTMIAFNIKCVEYELIEENILNKSDLLLKSNPVYKKIPVLIHRQRPICESLVILQYIDEVGLPGPQSSLLIPTIGPQPVSGLLTLMTRYVP
ncbi:UNVERIFIED_CONTAM: putative glutathione S-transferase [Sesamum latifolium]|uniref:Glutathione S-transferase n=1 Tax=Sesamum latifolium TaxID=2727402 RepID=A0AAW2UWJ0_9LAMI